MPLPSSVDRTTARSYGHDTPPEAIGLVRRAQAGDLEAFGELYRSQRLIVQRYLLSRMRLVRDWDTVPDLVQETFCEALADLANAHDNVRGWLFWHATCAFNRYEWSRRRHWRATYASRDAARIAAVSTEDDEPGRPERAWLFAVLPRLGSDQRRCVQLRYYEGFPAELVAWLMGRTTNAVRLLERRALRRLRFVLTVPGA